MSRIKQGEQVQTEDLENTAREFMPKAELVLVKINETMNYIDKNKVTLKETDIDKEILQLEQIKKTVEIKIASIEVQVKEFPK